MHRRPEPPEAPARDFLGVFAPGSSAPILIQTAVFLALTGVIWSVLFSDMREETWQKNMWLCLWVFFASLYFLSLWFFRDPKRVPETGGDVFPVLSPADGRVLCVEKVGAESAPEHLQGGTWWKICIFMNFYNVHVVRSPLDGEVKAMKYTPGKHIPAFKKESDRNEKLLVVLGDPPVAGVEMIAGAFARRIVPYIHVGDVVQKGERIGLIRYGSRVNLYLLEEYQPLVSRGEKVCAGESVVAEKKEKKESTGPAGGGV